MGLDVTLLGDIPDITEGGSYKELLAPRYMNMHPVNDTHQHISLVYFATSTTRYTVQGESEVSDELKWFTKEELDDASYGIGETIKYYAKAALDAAV